MQLSSHGLPTMNTEMQHHGFIRVGRDTEISASVQKFENMRNPTPMTCTNEQHRN